VLMLVEPGADPRTEPLSALRSERTPSDAAILVGPEGGWSEAEQLGAGQCGFRLVTLGQRTLRADAVPVAAISVLQFLWGDL
jgi:16S rRNA (uracil1498-N3)-methyltransferase